MQYCHSIGFLQGNEKGNLNVIAIPVDEKGSAIEDDYVDDPYLLVGKTISFKLKIVAARDLPSKYKNTHCRCISVIHRRHTASTLASPLP